MSTPTRALAHRVIELACRAPSVHNSQPWRWRVVDEATIELYADPDRQLLVSDPSGRNLALSCGAATHHSFVAAQALGLTAAVELMPSREDETLLARISVTSGTRTEEALETLQALEERCTDRRRFTSWPVPDSRLAHLATAASEWGAKAIPITDVTGRFRTEQLVNRAMTVQAADPRFAEEQRAWTVHSRREGMPMATAAPPRDGRTPTRANRFASATDVADAVAEAAQVVESSDGLVAICSADDDQLSWLKAGESLSALWLGATREGLSVVPLSQVIEVDETRQALHQDVFEGMARPQILLRVGWLESPRTRLDRTPRRPVGSVTTGSADLA
jgi:hypothetical protein